MQNGLDRLRWFLISCRPQSKTNAGLRTGVLDPDGSQCSAHLVYLIQYNAKLYHAYSGNLVNFLRVEDFSSAFLLVILELATVDAIVWQERVANAVFVVSVELAFESLALAVRVRVFDAASAMPLQLLGVAVVDVAVWIDDLAEADWNIIFEFSFVADSTAVFENAEAVLSVVVYLPNVDFFSI